MSTRSRIGIVRPDGTVKSIYQHFDGYPEHMMPLLTEFYNTQDIVEATVELGDASYLSKKINPETDNHSFETPEDDVSVFYHRDRGEDWEHTQPRISESEGAFLSLCSDSWAEYAYLFKDGEWHYYNI